MAYAAQPRQLTRRNLARSLWYIGLVAIVIVMGAPIVWMISAALRPEAEVLRAPSQILPIPFTLENLQSVFGRFAIGHWLFNSVFVAVVSTILVLILDSMAAYALARLEFRGRNILFFVLVAMLFVPMQAYVVPLFLLFSRLGLIDTYAALILPVGANVTGVFLLRQFFLSLPAEYEEAARIDGAGDFRIWYSVILPLARAPLTAVAILTFLSAWNSFLWPLIATNTDATRTLPVGIAQFLSTGGQSGSIFAQSMAAAVVASVPALIVFFVLQKQFVQGVSSGGVKG